MSYVFLILVYATGVGSNTMTTTTAMPSMGVCERMLDYHVDSLPRVEWNEHQISQPVNGYCTEVTE